MRLARRRRGARRADGQAISPCPGPASMMRLPRRGPPLTRRRDRRGVCLFLTRRVPVPRGGPPPESDDLPQTDSDFGASAAPGTRRSHVSEVKLTAQPRTEFGKGAARRLRRADMVPAVLYGHGTDPVHVALPGHATMMALKQSNALFELDVDGKTHAGPAEGRPARPAARLHRARRPADRPPRREGHGRRPAARHRRARLRRPGDRRGQHAEPRGRGHARSRRRSSTTSPACRSAPRCWPATSSCRRAPRSSPTPTRSW